MPSAGSKPGASGGGFLTSPPVSQSGPFSRLRGKVARASVTEGGSPTHRANHLRAPGRCSPHPAPPGLRPNSAASPATGGGEGRLDRQPTAVRLPIPQPLQSLTPIVARLIVAPSSHAILPLSAHRIAASTLARCGVSEWWGAWSRMPGVRRNFQLTTVSNPIKLAGRPIKSHRRQSAGRLA